MSVFNSDAGDQPTQNALEALVGEGKKFADVEGLAKGKLESDNYIEQLKSQIAELQGKVTESATLSEVLAKIEEQRAPSAPEPKPEAHQPAKPTGLTEDDLKARITEMLQEKDRAALVAKNVNEVAERLVAVYGTEEAANQYVKKRAQELGVSVEFLQDVAAKSPKAFFETVRVEEPNTPARPTQSEKNTIGLSNHNPGVKPNTYRWYQEIRKNQGQAAYDRVVLQMHEDAKRLGEKFYE